MTDRKLLALGMLTMLRSSASYIALPVLALHFNQRFSAVETSIIIAVPTVFPVFFGYLGHYFSERAGGRLSMRISLALDILAYLGYSIFGNFYLLAASSFISGVARAIWEPVTKSLFAFSESGADAAFRVRYIGICAAGVAGPLICAFLSHYSRFAYQIAAAIATFVLVGILTPRAVPFAPQNKANSARGAKVRETLNPANIAAILSPKFVSALVGGTLVYMAFSQFESVFPLFLDKYFEDAVKIFSTLLIVNSVVSALLQVCYMWIAGGAGRRVNNRLVILSGSAAFIAAYGLFIAGGSRLYIYIIGVCIYSLGEVLVMPAMDVALDAIAPEGKKALYYGVAEIRSIGFTAGPILAGAILQIASPSAMCAAAILFFAAGALFLSAGE